MIFPLKPPILCDFPIFIIHENHILSHFYLEICCVGCHLSLGCACKAWSSRTRCITGRSRVGSRSKAPRKPGEQRRGRRPHRRGKRPSATQWCLEESMIKYLYHKLNVEKSMIKLKMMVGCKFFEEVVSRLPEKRWWLPCLDSWMFCVWCSIDMFFER